MIVTPIQIQADFGKISYYDLPTANDPEYLPFTTSINGGHRYINLNSVSNQLEINPNNCATDFVAESIQIDLKD